MDAPANGDAATVVHLAHRCVRRVSADVVKVAIDTVGGQPFQR
jgi:hypothetical protein